MSYHPYLHHRRSVRLKGYDYSQSGAYFITICAYNRACLFGEIVSDSAGNVDCQPTVFGKIAIEEWYKTAEIRKNIELDAFVLMPNHIHGIIIIRHDIDGRGTVHRAPTREQFAKPTSNSIPTIIRSYKATVTKQINELKRTFGIPIWQKNYYEHIIRSDATFEKIRNYIVNNPFTWEQDILFERQTSRQKEIRNYNRSQKVDGIIM